MVGPAGGELAGVKVTAGHSDARDAGGVGSLRVVRGVTDGEALGWRQFFAIDEGCPGKSYLGELTTVCGIRAVAPEREEPVELGSVKLDVGRCLQVAGHDPEQIAVVQEPWQELLDAVEEPLACRLRHCLVEVVQASFQQLGELGSARLTGEDSFEGLAPHVRIGHATVGELADVGRDGVQLVEGHPP